MRTDDLSGGSLKALLVLLLVAANILVALPHDRRSPLVPASALAPLAELGASPSTRTTHGAQERGKFSAAAPKTAPAARALPGQPES
ncbi:MAG: hypothetical protein H0X34_20505 [Chthoniobacterales bacterium]|nr:hypothetical protein [Chthoniobacterales bacterium]